MKEASIAILKILVKSCTVFKILVCKVVLAVEGTCSGLPAGSISVQIYAGICYGESKVGQCFFG